MCGICGIWGQTSREPIEAMIRAMKHRGPDDSGLFLDGSAALGMTRLAILDLSPAGHQPMQTPDGLIHIVYNGELYNFRSERDQLEAQGYTFQSTSDTEVVLRLYERYGDDFLTRLRGMFALAIYDRRNGRERLLLARDHLGIKPLLYARVGERLIFASEMKALLASGMVNRDIDPVALRQLLTFGSVVQPRTMLAGVHMLLPAHRLIVEQGRMRIERYWSLETNRYPDLRQCAYEELVEELASVLKETVRLQMISDVPLGAFLSGGVDSALLVSMMARLTSHNVKTFSVGFEAEGQLMDESADALRTAQFLGTDHYAVIVRGNEVRDHIERIASGLDQPSVDGVNTYFVSMAARQQVTVAISGTGGDESFAGYPWFIDMVLAGQYDKVHPYQAAARSLLSLVARQKLLDRVSLSRFGGRFNRLRTPVDFVSQYASIYQIFGVNGAAQMLSPDLRLAAQAARSPYYDIQPIDEVSHGSPIERVTALCLRGYTNNQLMRDIDAVSMAHSLEVRVPYLDPVVVDVALSLPDSAKLGDLSKLVKPRESTYRATGAKRILIDVGRSRLPKDFDLQPKRGFYMPFAAWLKGSLADVLSDTLSSAKQRGLLNPLAVESVHRRFLDGAMDWPQPWLLMMTELWFRQIG